jgi:NADH:ubiquinone oxidoreductase subunit F (NADH-binding)
MTALLSPAPTAVVGAGTDVWTIGAPRLLAGLDRVPVLDLRTHLGVHGPLPATNPRNLLALLDAARLAGRGGAGFDFAAKVRALAGTRRTVIVNGSESEPASFKDRTLLGRAPHLVLDGALAVAGAVGASQVVVAVHDRTSAAAITHAISERADARTVSVSVIAGGFVAGEARAVVRALAGGPALPPGRRNHGTETGHLLSNPETFAQVALLLRLGAHRFASTGTAAEPGTTLLTISGAVARPGVVEIPIGTPLSIVLTAAGAAPDLAAVITGGYHGSWVSPDPALLVSRAGLAAARPYPASFGAGVLIALDHSTCSLGELGRVSAWLAGESARQCGPCRFGLPALAADVQSIYRGDASGLAAGARHVQAVDGRGACAHPDGTARFITSGLRHLTNEINAHVHNGGCGRPVRGLLPIGVSS